MSKYVFPTGIYKYVYWRISTCDINDMQKMFRVFILDMNMNATDLCLQPHLLGANEFKWLGLWIRHLNQDSRLTIIVSDNEVPGRRQPMEYRYFKP